MTKTKKYQTDQVRYILAGTSVAFAVISVILAFALYRAGDSPAPDPHTPPINVSLGPLQYSFEDGRAVRRDDPTVRGLKAFLAEESQESLAHGCDTVYYNVTAHNQAETQVLLSYGCGFPNANMFAVRDGDAWKTISPTNQFDVFGIPSCQHVEQNAISEEIAPVCVHGLGQSIEEVEYRVRQ